MNKGRRGSKCIGIALNVDAKFDDVAVLESSRVLGKDAASIEVGAVARVVVFDMDRLCVANVSIDKVIWVDRRKRSEVKAISMKMGGTSYLCGHVQVDLGVLAADNRTVNPAIVYSGDQFLGTLASSSNTG